MVIQAMPTVTFVFGGFAASRDVLGWSNILSLRCSNIFIHAPQRVDTNSANEFRVCWA